MENSEVKTLKAVRKFIFSQIRDLPEEKYYIIPSHFKTNIIWNLGHLVVSQQLLTYKRASLPLKVDDTLLSLFRKGSTPAEEKNMPQISEVINLFLEIPEYLETDLNSGLFKNYEKYETSSGMILENINDANAYNNFHEGLHLGIIQSLIKFI